MHVERQNPRALPTRPVIPVMVVVVVAVAVMLVAAKEARKGSDRTGPVDRYSSRIEEIPARDLANPPPAIDGTPPPGLRQERSARQTP